MHIFCTSKVSLKPTDNTGMSPHSQRFDVQGSGKKPYTVTINYQTGHWCTCRGMIAKKSTYGEEAGRTLGTSCKHIDKIINTHFNSDWGTKTKSGARQPKAITPKTSKPASVLAPPAPSGRRAAIAATKAKVEQQIQAQVNTEPNMDLAARIARLEGSR